jgi:hypothetical protein
MKKLCCLIGSRNKDKASERQIQDVVRFDEGAPVPGRLEEPFDGKNSKNE